MKRSRYSGASDKIHFNAPTPYSHIIVALDTAFEVINGAYSGGALTEAERKDLLSVRAALAKIEDRVSGLDEVHRATGGAH